MHVFVYVYEEKHAMSKTLVVQANSLFLTMRPSEFGRKTLSSSMEQAQGPRDLRVEAEFKEGLSGKHGVYLNYFTAFSGLFIL